MSRPASSVDPSLLTAVPNKTVRLSTCNLNQWALDFDGNLERIKESILIAKRQGAKYRLGPELELCGYDCEDHFLEMDTFLHCEQSLAELLRGDLTDDLLCDLGCPVLHHGVRYNCRIFCVNRKIVLIRPKIFLADDGNYREKRWFSSWDRSRTSLADHALSELLRGVTGQRSAPMGLAVLRTAECTIASEICEELWAPRAVHIDLFLRGAHIVTNGSASHHELRKLENRLSLMRHATKQCGGVYLYANHRGCGGSRVYYDGSACIVSNGDVINQTTQFSLKDVEVITENVDIDAIEDYRQRHNALQEQASSSHTTHTYNVLPVIDLSDSLSLRSGVSLSPSLSPSLSLSPRVVTAAEEECARGPACWLWDYLRRSGACGVLLPLSGGADSAAVAAIIRVMCATLAEEIVSEKNQQACRDVLRLFGGREREIQRVVSECLVSENESERETERDLVANALSLVQHDSTQASHITQATQETAQATQRSLTDLLCRQVLHTVYLGSKNSSWNTQDRAYRLAQRLHSYHHTLSIDTVVESVLSVFSLLTGKQPRYETHGGTANEDLALQNIQARIRMIFAYLCAQLFPWLRGYTGFLLVLGSANVDEALRGYMTKYDCSSADVNPIGGMCKSDLKKMLLWVAEKYDVHELKEIAMAAPSAELRPIDDNADTKDSTQLDEVEMGMTYEELSVFGKLRKISHCGPVRMFVKLLDMWQHISPQEVAVKVKRFFYFYSVNRHKMTTLTPSYHAESYSPDDNRFDLRPFLYNTKWTRQFDTIDAMVNAKSSPA